MTESNLHGRVADLVSLTVDEVAAGGQRGLIRFSRFADVEAFDCERMIGFLRFALDGVDVLGRSVKRHALEEAAIRDLLAHARHRANSDCDQDDAAQSEPRQEPAARIPVREFQHEQDAEKHKERRCERAPQFAVGNRRVLDRCDVVKTSLLQEEILDEREQTRGHEIRPLGLFDVQKQIEIKPLCSVSGQDHACRLCDGDQGNAGIKS